MIFRLTHSWNLWMWFVNNLEGHIYIYIHTYMGQSEKLGVKLLKRMKKRGSKKHQKTQKNIKKWWKVEFSNKSWKVSKKTSLKGRRLYGHLFSVFSTFFYVFSSFFVFFWLFLSFFSCFLRVFFLFFCLFLSFFMIFLLFFIKLFQSLIFLGHDETFSLTPVFPFFKCRAFAMLTHYNNYSIRNIVSFDDISICHCLLLLCYNFSVFIYILFSMFIKYSPGGEYP